MCPDSKIIIKSAKNPQVFISMFLSIALATFGCGLKSVPPKSRKFLPDLKKEIKLIEPTPEFSEPILKSTNSNDAEPNLNSCQYLNYLSQKTGRGVYSYYKNVSSPFVNIKTKKASVVGAIRIDESPLTQMVLSTFNAPTNEEFLKIAEEKYKKGELSWLEIQTVRAASHFTPIMNKIKFSKTNDALEEAFPGIFGVDTEISKSLYISLAKKSGAIDTHFSETSQLAQQTFITPILTTVTPLMPDDFTELNNDMTLSMKVALAGFDQSNTDREIRACSLVLLQRSFAQLLSLKGYPAPIVKYAAKGGLIAWPLSASHPKFESQPQTGYFYDVSSDKNVLLEASDIQNYDPTKKLLIISNSNRNSPQENTNLLDQHLSLLNAMTSVFIATNPSVSKNQSNTKNDQPNIKTNIKYFLGDIKNPKTSAVLPLESNSLALGFISMVLKNLNFLNIRKIDSAGKLTINDDLARGLMLVDSVSLNNSKSNQLGLNDNIISLNSALRLLKTCARLEHSLANLEKKPMEFWQSINPDFNKERLDSLKGLRGILQKLIFPLTAMSLKLSDTEGKCIATAIWNSESGKVTPLSQCSEEEKLNFEDSMLFTAEATQSPALYHRFSKKTSAEIN